MSDIIQFNKQRDFGEVFNASFTFIKQEFKGLILKVFLYTAPIAIIVGLVSVYFQREILNIKQFQNNGDLGFISKFMSLYFIILVVQLLNFSAIFSSVFAYLKLYTTQEGKVEHSEFNKLYFNSIGKNILYLLLIGIICGVGTAFCLFPGIYLFIVLSLAFPILYFENVTLGDAITRSFKLSKNNWWLNFGIIFISYLIIFVLSIVLSIPNYIINAAVALHTVQQTEIPAAINISNKILAVIIAMCSSLFYIIPCTVISFQYFSCKEKADMTNVMNKIETIGNE